MHLSLQCNYKIWFYLFHQVTLYSHCLFWRCWLHFWRVEQFYPKNCNPKLKWLLFIILSEIGLHFIVIMFILTGVIIDFPFLSRGLYPYYYIIQPAIYFYVLVNLNENYKFTRKDLFHLIPLVLSFIDNWGFYSLGPEHWQYWANSISNNFAFLTKYPGKLILSKFHFI